MKYKFHFYIFLLEFCLISFVQSNSEWDQRNKNFEEIFENVKSQTLAQVQADAAIDVIYRLIPEAAHNFNVTINVLLPDNSFSVYKDENSSIVYITASSGVAACHGFYHYIKYYCGCQVAWEGVQLELPENLPPIDIHIKAPSQFVYFQNVCTWSYSYTWWTFDQWRRHIDWIALHGITLTLAPFQEDVWTNLFTSYGVHRREIDDYFAGPAFLAWQRMGNLRGWGGPLSGNYKNFSSNLQRRVVRSLRDLGISVALPAFSGHVPPAFKRLFPNATLTPAQKWNKFPEENCCPLFLDPMDPLYASVGESFLKEVISTYGTDHIFFADPFNEIVPRYADASYLGNTSLAIYETMKKVDPHAVWLLQGWMFLHDTIFWRNELVEAFLTAVPQGRILVLDLQSEQFPQYERTNSYYGQPFIWCMLHNFGGTLGMHGSAEIVYNRILETRNNTSMTMVGVGITPEGINQNHVMYEFALEMGWNTKTLDPENWFKHYGFARYGGGYLEADRAWELLLKSVYSYRGLEKLRGKYTISRRPSLKLVPWTWYNVSFVDEALSLLLQLSHRIQESALTLYNHDVVDITRQFLQNRADQLYLTIVEAYHDRDSNRVTEYSEIFLNLLLDLDKILRTSNRFLLGTWLASAKRLGQNKVEKEIYEFNARNQITLWGPNGQIVDYANKQWSGVVADYFYKRWKMFFSEMESALQNNQPLDDRKVKGKIFKWVEEPFNVDRKTYPVRKEGNTIEIAQQIFSKYIRMGHLPDVQIRHHAHSDPNLEEGPILYPKSSDNESESQTRMGKSKKRFFHKTIQAP